MEVAILVLTGIALFFLYRPTAAQVWEDVLRDGQAWDVRIASVLRVLHRLAGYLAVLTAIVVAGLIAVRGAQSASRTPGVMIGIALVVATAATDLTGVLLPWDQLALWAVTVGTDMSGNGVLFKDEVRFVIIDNVEVATGTLVRWCWCTC